MRSEQSKYKAKRRKKRMITLTCGGTPNDYAINVLKRKGFMYLADRKQWMKWPAMDEEDRASLQRRLRRQSSNEQTIVLQTRDWNDLQIAVTMNAKPIDSAWS